MKSGQERLQTGMTFQEALLCWLEDYIRKMYVSMLTEWQHTYGFKSFLDVCPPGTILDVKGASGCIEFNDKAEPQCTSFDVELIENITLPDINSRVIDEGTIQDGPLKKYLKRKLHKKLTGKKFWNDVAALILSGETPEECSKRSASDLFTDLFETNSERVNSEDIKKKNLKEIGALLFLEPQQHKALTQAQYSLLLRIYRDSKGSLDTQVRTKDTESRAAGNLARRRLLTKVSKGLFCLTFQGKLLAEIATS